MFQNLTYLIFVVLTGEEELKYPQATFVDAIS